MSIRDKKAKRQKNPPADNQDHYLKEELYHLVRGDPTIFDFLQNGSLDGIWYWDLQMQDHEWMSPRFWEVFGYDPEEKPHLVEAWQDMINAEDLKVVLDNFEKHCKNPKYPFDQIVRYRHKDGSTVWVRCRGIAVRDEKGKPVRMLGAHTEVTALKDTEAALKKKTDELQHLNEVLERSNKELDDFAYIASHDLKEPLRGIHNYAAFLYEDYKDKLDDDGVDKLKTLQRLTKRMEHLIDALLYYSRTGRQNMAIRKTDLNELISEVIDSLHISLAENNVDVRIPDSLPTITCDPTRISEVFRNLIVNAMKYNDKPDKWIEIGLNKGVHPIERKKEEGASGNEFSEDVFYVRDNGIGIRENHLATVFTIFKRLHGRDKYGGGTGAGLTIVKKIIERHGGSIWVESTYGEGSTFYFTLSGKDIDL